MAKVNLTDRTVSATKAKPGERVELWDALTPGLCLRVTDNGVKSWVLRYRAADGRQPRLKIGDANRMTLKAARIEAGRLKDLIFKGGDPQAERRQARAAAKAVTVRTFGDLMDAYWLACEAGTWKPKRKKKRPQTLAYEKRLAESHLTPEFKRLPLAEVKRSTVEGLLEAMLVRGIGLQTNRTHAIIRQVFNYGIAKEHVTLNPALNIPPLHDGASRRRIWLDGELGKLWRTCQNPTDLRKADGSKVYVARSTAIAVQLCALLLQRRNEVAGMAVEELNLPEKVWLIAPERMKGGKAHQVPLPDRAVELIEEALRLAQVGTNEALTVVFPSPRDKHTPITPGALTQAVSKMREATGATDATVHDLRRTGSTVLTSERIGVSPFIRSKVLGHGTDAGGGAAVSAAHYDVNEYLPEKRRALEAWAGLLLEIVGERTTPSNVTQIRGTGR